MSLSSYTNQDFQLKEVEIAAAVSRVLKDFLLSPNDKLDLLKRALALLLFHPETSNKLILRSQIEIRVRQLEDIVRLEYANAVLIGGNIMM